MTPEERIALLVEEFSRQPHQLKKETVILGICLAAAVRRVSGTGTALELSQPHWDLIAGAAMALSGCRGPVVVFAALEWYAVHVAGVHLFGNERKLMALRHALQHEVPQRIKDIVRDVDGALRAWGPPSSKPGGALRLARKR
jgi:hypothetical protein